MQTVVRGDCISSKASLLLKAAVWAVCHACSSPTALHHMGQVVLQAVVHLAATASVYSVRGTCYMALCAVATTDQGVAMLREYGQ